MLGSPRPSLVDADQELIHLRVGCVESRRLSDFMLAEAEMAASRRHCGQSNCALPRSPGIILIVSGGRREPTVWRCQGAKLSVSAVSHLFRPRGAP